MQAIIYILAYFSR